MESTRVKVFGTRFNGLVDDDGNAYVEITALDGVRSQHDDMRVRRTKTEWRVEPDAAAFSGILDSYDSFGPYMQLARGDALAHSRVSLKGGVPQVTYPFGGPYRYPTEVARYGLEQFSKDKLPRALVQGEWLLDQQDRDGGWPVPFDLGWHGDRAAVLEAGWRSAMTSGMAISLFVRLGRATGEKRWNKAAARALPLLETPVSDGGLWDSVLGLPMLQLYPTAPPLAVFNGWMSALIGVHDATVALGRGQDLFDEQVDTLRALLPMFDLGNRTAYDLSHIHHPSAPPNVARWGYHRTNLSTLSVIDMICGGEFRDVVERWEGYMRGEAVSPV